VKCPICGEPVDVPDDALPGELIDHDCGVTLEIVMEGSSVKLRPLEIKEDWGE